MNQHIETVPDKCGGMPVVAGTRIRVWDVYVLHEQQGKSPDDIVAAYPQLTLADVHAALAYYWDNKDAILEQVRSADEFVESLMKANLPGPLAQKISSVDSSHDPLSS